MTKKLFGTVRSALVCAVVVAASSVNAYAAKLDAAGVKVIIDGEYNYYRTTDKTVGAFLENNNITVDEAAVINVDRDDAITNDMKIVIDSPLNIVVKVDNGSNMAVSTNAETVGRYIDELKAQTGGDYFCRGYNLEDPLVDGMLLNLVSLTSEAVDTTEEIAYDTKKVDSDELYKGETKVTQKGVKGIKTVTTTTSYEGGKVIGTTTSESITKQPVTEIIAVGTKEKPVVVETPAVTTSTSTFNGKAVKALTMNATAYCPCASCCGSWANGYTANGMKAGYGVAAVDTSVIPLGTKLYVEGYGYAIAADTGGAIKGNRIDLCYGTHSAALASGYGHTNVKVYVLG